jgi:hypothetical protein
MESMKDSIRILPFSRVSTSATACRSASSGASAAISASARSCGVRAAQAGNHLQRVIGPDALAVDVELGSDLGQLVQRRH